MKTRDSTFIVVVLGVVAVGGYFFLLHSIGN